MRNARRLTLRKEALTDLTTDEIAGVAGAQQQTAYCPYSLLQCHTHDKVCTAISAAIQDCPLG
jgi:hypothetical protein